MERAQDRRPSTPSATSRSRSGRCRTGGLGRTRSAQTPSPRWTRRRHAPAKQRVSRSCRSRSISLSGNVGRSATSASSGSASSSRCDGDVQANCGRVVGAGGGQAGAEKLDCVGDLQRRAGAGALVEHRGGQAGGPEFTRRIVVSAGAHDEAQLDDGNLVSFDHPHGEPVRQRTFRDRRQVQLRWAGASAGGCERSGASWAKTIPPIASECERSNHEGHEDREVDAWTLLRVAGSTISSTRRSGGSHRSTAAWMSVRRERHVSGEVFGIRIWSAAGEVVRIQLVRFAAKSADALHAAIERCFDLVERRAAARASREARGAASSSSSSMTFWISAMVWPGLRGGDDEKRSAEGRALLNSGHVLRDLHLVDEP